MPADREQLAKAIVAAADLEFSQFKDAIQDTVEQRFKDRIGEIAQDRATKLFNPNAEVEEDDLDPQDPENLDPDDLDDPLDELDPDDPPEDPEDPPADLDDPPADPDDPPTDPEPAD